MDDDVLRNEIRKVLTTDTPDYRIVIDSGTLYYRIVPVRSTEYRSGYISSGAGRWNLEGEGCRYAAEDFKICAQELGLEDNADAMQDCTFEIHRVDQTITGFNVACLPKHIQESIYEQSSELPHKWHRSWILIQELRRADYPHEIDVVYAPNASGLALGISGMCLEFDPNHVATTCLATGGYQNWKNDDFDLSER